MNSSAFMENLRQLFGECDRDQSGSLGPDEFKELCQKIGLSRDMAEETFKRLDIDQNSQITFEEFAAGFDQYQKQQSGAAEASPSAASAGVAQTKPQGLHTQTLPGGASTPPRGAASAGQMGASNTSKLVSSPVTRRAQSRASPSNNNNHNHNHGQVSLGSTGSSSNLTSGRSTSSSGGLPFEHCLSSTDLSSSYEATTADQSRNSNVVVYSSDLIDSSNYQPEPASGHSSQFGSIMSSNGSFNQLKTMQDLLECVQKLQNENQILTQIFFKDKREREEYISQLGEEFDQQLREVEERANKRAKEELEAEKRRLSEMMQTERETLQHHYSTLEKISKMVKSSTNGKAQDGETFNRVKSQLEDTFVENRQLKKSLMDTKTDVAMIWKEMEKIKKQYEDKLSSAYEKQRETQHECDHIKLQLNLMKDSNRKLQDASDVITNYITDKVEPVIKVATCMEDDPNNGDGSLSHHHHQLSNGRINNPSAPSSRRGSILSEYLNNNDADADDDDDASGMYLEPTGSGGGGGTKYTRNHRMVGSHEDGDDEIDYDPNMKSRLSAKRHNGLETSLSRNQRFNRSTTSTSTSSSDNHLLSVPQSTTSSSPVSNSTKQQQQQQQQQQNSIKDSSRRESHEANEPRLNNSATYNKSVQNKHEPHPATKPKSNKQLGESQVHSAKASLRSIGRHFMLGDRTQSDAKPKDAKEQAESKSMSLDNQAEASIEPSDGPSVATFNVILVGDSFVGKSSFAARFIEGSFVQGLISNCSIDFKTKTYKVDGVNYTVNLWDTAGQERFRSITASYFRKADGIILMYDVTDKRSYLNVRNWMSTIADTAAENVAVLLVGNKIDLRVNDNKAKCIPTEEGFRLAREYGIVFLETSVKTGTNLLPSMGRLIRLIAKNNTVEETDHDRIRLSDKGRTFNCMPKNC